MKSFTENVFTYNKEIIITTEGPGYLYVDTYQIIDKPNGISVDPYDQGTLSSEHFPEGFYKHNDDFFAVVKEKINGEDALVKYEMISDEAIASKVDFIEGTLNDLRSITNLF